MMRKIARYKCPWCKEYIFGTVKDTRVQDGAIVRKRECENCGTYMMTKETIFAMVKNRKVVSV